MRNVSEITRRRNHNIYFMFKFFFFENRIFCEIMWKNFAEPGRQQTEIWRRRIACWIPKRLQTHSEYVMLTPFPLQQWLHERASMLCFTYSACALIIKPTRCTNFSNLFYRWGVAWTDFVKTGFDSRPLLFLTFRWPCIVINSYNKTN